MPGTMGRSAPSIAVQVADLTASDRTARLSCRRPKKREYSRQFGVHLGNPGLRSRYPGNIGVNCRAARH
jgi:hypothetical protein